MSSPLPAHRSAPDIKVDTHAHVYDYSCPMVPGRRYSPEIEAPLESYLSLLESHDITHGVLIQPSFLGTDNSFILDSIKANPNQLRGIAVVPPDISQIELQSYASQGIVGIRLNLVGSDPYIIQTPKWKALFEQISVLNWQIEVQVESEHTAWVLSNLLPTGIKIVIDHFGKPDPKNGVDDTGFKALLKGAQSSHLWVKLSAPYRCGGVDVQPYANALLAEFGPQRLLWGSDWPWLQHRDNKDYHSLLGNLTDWVPDPAQREEILGSSAFALFGFEEEITGITV